jgi:hypothetical protein
LVLTEIGQRRYAVGWLVAVVRRRKGVTVVDRVAAVTDRLLVDVGADGRVSVSTWLDGELPSPASEPVELVWPLDAEALEELRWYLEDYLRAPFGAYEGPRLAGGGEAARLG